MPADQSEDGRTTYTRPFVDPPHSVVQDGKFVFGCFNQPPVVANMLDVHLPYHYPVPRWVKKFRCKEWVAFQFGNERWFFFALLFEAKSLSMAQFSAWDRERGKLHEFRHVWPLANFNIGERLEGHTIGCRSVRHSLRASFDLAAGSMTVDALAASSYRHTRFAGSFTFAYNTRQTAPMSACMPLGLNRAVYSTKVLMPMQGWFRVDDERFEFSHQDSMGIIDDHKGYYPYTMHYDWVTGFGRDAKGRRVGFNLTDNQVKDQYTWNENVLWINSRVFPLPPIRVTRPNGPDQPWHIQDTEGLVDLVFRPERRNNLKMNMFVLAVDYHGPFGSFEGTLRSPDGEKVDAKGLFGMGEQQYLRA